MSSRSPIVPAALVLVLALGATAAHAGAADEARHAWQYRREVRLVESAAVHPGATTREGAPAGEASHPGGGEGLALGRLDVDPEVEARSQPGLGDLRLLDAAGDEVPYALVTARPPAPCTGALVDVSRRAEVASAWTIELERPCRLEAVSLAIEARDFAKSALLEASDDRQAWRVVARAASVFDQDWHGRVHHTEIALAAPETARWLRVTLDDRESAPVDVSGVTVRSPGAGGPSRWSRPIELGPPVREGESRRYALRMPLPLRPDRLVLDADDAFFAREVTVVARVRDGAGRERESTVGRGTIYRFRAIGAARAGEGHAIEVSEVPEGASLELVVADHDDRPLGRLRAVAEGLQRSLVFTSASPAPVVLWYGNPQTRAPGYDLATVADELRPEAAERVYRSGPEQKNSAFRPMPPLSFVDSRGARLDAGSYAWTRSIELADGDDIYSVFLEPEDLARAQPSLADVRVVDGKGNQVPYVLEPGAGERWLPLAIAPPRGGGRHGVSRTALVAKGLGDDLEVPVSALSLDVAERFFSRSMFVTRTVPRDEGRRVVLAGVLSRSAGEAGPVVVAVPPVRTRELALEVEDGDNAPLTIHGARARVSIPRLAFKWTGDPAGLRLVYGAPRVAAPQYDLSTLRGEVLAYAARPARLGPVARNPAYGSTAAAIGDLSTARTVLWIALVVLVAGLLLVVVRLVKKLGPADRR